MAYRDLLEALKSKESALTGTVQKKEDCVALQTGLPDGIVPDWLVNLLSQFPLCGSEFELAEENDTSGLGASVGWLDLDGILSEARDCQPGLSVLKLRFLPFGSDLTGSGDPYFLDLRDNSEDPMVVRIPHSYAVESNYPLDKVEPVCTLSKLIQASEV